MKMPRQIAAASDLSCLWDEVIAPDTPVLESFHAVDSTADLLFLMALEQQLELDPVQGLEAVDFVLNDSQDTTSIGVCFTESSAFFHIPSHR
jgi:hypothetical protein